MAERPERPEKIDIVDKIPDKQSNDFENQQNSLKTYKENICNKSNIKT